MIEVVFLSQPLRTDHIFGTKRARLVEPYVCVYVGEDGRQKEEVVEKGFETDWGSIPKICRRLHDPYSKYNGPYVVHDKKYRVQDCSRKFADQLLLGCMRYVDKEIESLIMADDSVDLQKPCGVCRRSIYEAVRAGGWIGWRENQRRRKRSGNGSVSSGQ